jgi:hypothetical protein
VASRKNHRPSGQQIDLSVTRVPADEARIRAIVEALAEIGLAHLRALEEPAKPREERPDAEPSGGVA